MSVPLTGPILFSQIQAEFGGASPISLSQYYRGGSRVPNAPLNARIPTSGTVSFSDYRGTRRSTVITYEIIGAGGGGGYGLEDGFGGGSGGSGGASSILLLVGGASIASAAGGAGGANGSVGWNDSPSRAGQSTVYGAGGPAASNGAPGLPAPSTSYGAGGGGAGGDSPNRYDSSGAAGQGGFAGVYVTGTFTIDYGTQLNILIGAGGAGGTGGVYDGGRGANGFCRFTYDGRVIDFTTGSVYTVV